jgi:hypothetical protein
MRSQYKGAQILIKKRISRKFYVSCANHTLNHMVYDAAKSATCAINFLGSVQRILTFVLLYELFGEKYRKVILSQL